MNINLHKKRRKCQKQINQYTLQMYFRQTLTAPNTVGTPLGTSWSQKKIRIMTGISIHLPWTNIQIREGGVIAIGIYIVRYTDGSNTEMVFILFSVRIFKWNLPGNLMLKTKAPVFMFYRPDIVLMHLKGEGPPGAFGFIGLLSHNIDICQNIIWDRPKHSVLWTLNVVGIRSHEHLM